MADDCTEGTVVGGTLEAAYGALLVRNSSARIHIGENVAVKGMLWANEELLPDDDGSGEDEDPYTGESSLDDGELYQNHNAGVDMLSDPSDEAELEEKSRIRETMLKLLSR